MPVPGAAAYAGIAYEITTEAEARRAVEELAASEVDIVKIWVDDRNGRAPQLSPALYGAVIDAAHERDLRVNAHVFYHADAEGLVAAGIDGLVHMVRDVEMSDALIAEIVERNVYVNANMSSPRRATQVGTPPWLTSADPMLQLLTESVAPDVIAKMEAAFRQRDSQAAAEARERYAILERSLAKLSAAGAKVVLGADTGVEDHLFGLAEHLELQAMVDAGMTPAQVLVAATSRAAEYLHLDDRGSLVPGKRADLLVLDASPLDDIVNTRRISRLFINGVEIDRAALRAQIEPCASGARSGDALGRSDRVTQRSRCHAELGDELSPKVTDVLETDRPRDALHGQIGGGEAPFREIDAPSEHVLMRREARRALEAAAKMERDSSRRALRARRS